MQAPTDKRTEQNQMIKDKPCDKARQTLEKRKGGQGINGAGFEDGGRVRFT